MATWLGRAKGGQSSAAFDAVGHWTQGAFFCGFPLVPAAMIIAQTIDVRLAIRRASPGFEVARSATRTMRIGKTLDTLRAFANGLEHVAGDQATHVIAARARRRITRPRAALRVIDAAHAFGRRCRLSLAIRRIASARIAAQTAAFVLRARLTHAAQAESTIAAIGVLTAFRTCRSYRSRQTERESRHLRAIDDDGLESEAIDAGITTTDRRIVFRQSVHAAPDGQIANGPAALRIRRAFDAKRLPHRLDRCAFHLVAELTLRTTIARRARARIGCGTRLAIFAVARLAFRTIRIVITFVAGPRNGIAGKTTRTIGIRPTSATRQFAIDVHTERRLSTTRRTAGTTQRCRIAGRTQGCIIAIIPRQTPIVTRLVHERPVALLTHGQIGERRVSAERLEKRSRGKKREASVLQIDDRRLTRRDCRTNIVERANEVRHFERRMLDDFHIKNFDRIQPWLFKGHLLGQAPRGGTYDRSVHQHGILYPRFPEKRQTHAIVRVKPEVDRLVHQIRRHVEIPAKTFRE